ncbi:MAG: Hint domain-containing protein [Myxococcaceae bacterium]
MKILILLLLICTASSAELSFTAILERCTEQNLNPKDAEIRNQWAKRCFPKQKEYFDFFSHKKPTRYALVWSPKAKSWKGPLDKNAACSDWELKTFCVASCYTPDQKILFASGELAIGAAFEQNENVLMVLQEGSSLEHPVLKPMPVKAYSRSWQDAHEIIRVIKTQSGGQLKVTENHPILLSSGIMIEARDLEEGDLLVKQDGQRDPVVSIENIDYYGRVFNLTPASSNPTENIIVAQGFLIGSGAYQYDEDLYKLIHARNRTHHR